MRPHTPPARGTDRREVPPNERAGPTEMTGPALAAHRAELANLGRRQLGTVTDGLVHQLMHRCGASVEIGPGLGVGVERGVQVGEIGSDFASGDDVERAGLEDVAPGIEQRLPIGERDRPSFEDRLRRRDLSLETTNDGERFVATAVRSRQLRVARRGQ